MQSNRTIYALSSGGLPSGVAIIRLSGPDVRQIVTSIAGVLPVPRTAKYVAFKDPQTDMLLDRGLVLFFPGPESFTGEDCGELHIHGGRAVVTAVLEVLERFAGTVMAEPGEFTRRAYLNDKMDLTAVEGLSDLLAAQTDAQRVQALGLQSGALREVCDTWRAELVRLRAYIEAEIDFADEDDVPGSVSDQVWDRCRELMKALERFLDDKRQGEIIRDGYRVALVGPPNAGKSSLLNALAKRDVAIVSDEPGTTRDIVEVSLDIGGVLVIVGDTAGQRVADSKVEQEGIRRARDYAARADLVLGLFEAGKGTECEGFDLDDVDVLVCTKRDKYGVFDTGFDSRETVSISVKEEQGLADLMELLSGRVSHFATSNEAVLTRPRHRALIMEALEALRMAVADERPLELRAEELRVAGDALGSISGRIDVEELLGAIFSEFCVGK